MKKTLTLVIFAFLFTWNFSIAQCVRSGNFVSNDSSTPTSGSASLVFETNGDKKIKLGSNFSGTNGPDLHVILTKTAFYNPNTDLIISEVLTQITGAQTYDVPNTVDLSQFEYVLIHCVAYNHRFGYAKLGNSSGASCASLSVSNFNTKENLIAIFPNPTQDKLYFSLENVATVSVYNLAGKKLVSDSRVTAKNNSISLASQPKGIYFVEIILNNKKTIQKIVKE